MSGLMCNRCRNSFLLQHLFYFIAYATTSLRREILITEMLYTLSRAYKSHYYNKPNSAYNSMSHFAITTNC